MLIPTVYAKDHSRTNATTRVTLNAGQITTKMHIIGLYDRLGRRISPENHQNPHFSKKTKG
jgi:hypothetical protein